ncbi:MAG TPA: hypothetical protein VNB94_13725 [Mycobacteriales bacterium]|nr:hypothetical protein [Mycobacteriales bacterium]
MHRRIATVAVIAGAGALVLLAPAAAYAATPQVTDQQDDAYEDSPGLPNPLFSDPALDITAIEWAKSGRDNFTVTMTIKGTPKTGVNYYPSAEVGDAHEVYWILNVGSTAFYNVFALDPATGKQTGQVSTTYGSAVQVSGNTVSATFSAKRNRLPATLRDNPVLGPFGGLTCVAPENCNGGRTYDIARSPADTRFSLA